MDELHAAIAAYLHRAARVQSLKRRHEAAIMAIWYERSGMPHCRYCGRPITDDDGLYNLADMREVRECASHYTLF